MSTTAVSTFLDESLRSWRFEHQFTEKRGRPATTLRSDRLARRYRRADWVFVILRVAAVEYRVADAVEHRVVRAELGSHPTANVVCDTLVSGGVSRRSRLDCGPRRSRLEVQVRELNPGRNKLLADSILAVVPHSTFREWVRARYAALTGRNVKKRSRCEN